MKSAGRLSAPGTAASTSARQGECDRRPGIEQQQHGDDHQVLRCQPTGRTIMASGECSHRQSGGPTGIISFEPTPASGAGPPVRGLLSALVLEARVGACGAVSQLHLHRALLLATAQLEVTSSPGFFELTTPITSSIDFTFLPSIATSTSPPSRMSAPPIETGVSPPLTPRLAGRPARLLDQHALGPWAGSGSRPSTS